MNIKQARKKFPPNSKVHAKGDRTRYQGTVIGYFESHEFDFGEGAPVEPRTPRLP